MNNLSLLMTAAAVGTVLIAKGLMALPSPTSLPLSTSDPTCDIKGNVSINSRERIYHVPGQQDYDATKISPEYGERWFCSEAHARAAGWRKAGR